MDYRQALARFLAAGGVVNHIEHFPEWDTFIVLLRLNGKSATAESYALDTCIAYGIQRLMDS